MLRPTHPYQHWPVNHPNFQNGHYHAWDIVTRCDGSNFMGTLRRPRPANFAVASCGCNHSPCSCGITRIPTALPNLKRSSIDFLDSNKLSAARTAELIKSLKDLDSCKSSCDSIVKDTGVCPTIDKLLGMGEVIYAIMSDKTVMEVPRSKLQLCDENGLPTTVVTNVTKTLDSLSLTLTNLDTDEESIVTFTPAIPKISDASVTTKGLTRYATEAEVLAGRVDNAAVTPATLAKALESASKGLDCEAIKALPTSAWKDGMTLLAQTKEGACIRLNSNGSVFKDVAVDYSTNKVSGNTGDTVFELSARVTNNSLSSVEGVVLTLVNPAGTGYTIERTTVSKSNSNMNVEEGRLVYKVPTMNSGENFTVRQSVKVTADGTYRFTAQVVSSAVDILENNNSSSIAISAIAAIDPNYVATPDCPPIRVVHDRTGIQLNMARSNSLKTSDNNSRYIFNTITTVRDQPTQTLNLIPTDTGNLEGETFTLTGASTVIVYASKTRVDPALKYIENVPTNSWLMYDNNHAAVPGGSVEVASINDMEKASLQTVSVFPTYTFNPSNGKLTINRPETSDGKPYSITVLCRVGANCKWQGFNIHAAKKLTTFTTQVSNPGNAVISKEVITELEEGKSTGEIENPTAFVKWLKPREEGQSRGFFYQSVRSIRKVEKTIIRLKPGTVYNINISSEIPLFKGYETQGTLKITPTTDGTSVNISSTTALSAADKVNFPLLSITTEV